MERVMSNEFSPWNVEQMTADDPPFLSLLAEARAALDAPGATVADVKKRYRRALAAGSEHLDAPPTIDSVAAALSLADPWSDEYDDGPFAEGLHCSPLPLRSGERRNRRRSKPPPIPKRTAVEHVRRLFGRSA